MISCSNCGSTNIRKDGHTSKGNQKYKCKNCGKRFTEKPRNIFKNVSITCPSCNSLNIGKRGCTRNGNPRYMCKDCGKSFVLKYPDPIISTEHKKLILFYNKNFGVSIKSLAKNLHHSQRTISKFLKETNQ